jgi:hypothetical protein
MAKSYKILIGSRATAQQLHGQIAACGITSDQILVANTMKVIRENLREDEPQVVFLDTKINHELGDCADTLGCINLNSPKAHIILFGTQTRLVHHWDEVVGYFQKHNVQLAM